MNPETTTSIGLARIDLSAVIVVIPALNEEASLPHVLRDLPAVGEVIVVDNAQLTIRRTPPARAGPPLSKKRGAAMAPPVCGAWR